MVFTVACTKCGNFFLGGVVGTRNWMKMLILGFFFSKGLSQVSSSIPGSCVCPVVGILAALRTLQAARFTDASKLHPEARWHQRHSALQLRPGKRRTNKTRVSGRRVPMLLMCSCEAAGNGCPGQKAAPILHPRCCGRTAFYLFKLLMFSKAARHPGHQREPCGDHMQQKLMCCSAPGSCSRWAGAGSCLSATAASMVTTA